MSRIVVLGVRHHGPGSARSVLAELDRLQPAAVVIEGPADADPIAHLAAAEGMAPPVALLAYAPDAPQTSVFWPFAGFSPEWQALRWALAHDVGVRFCDLPSASVLARVTEPPPRRRARPVDPIAELARAAGHDDPERWWDAVVESRTLDAESPFPTLLEAMTELRRDAPEEDVWEQRREAYMRRTLRAVLKEVDGPVAVVCGAWHGPALAEPLPPAAADTRILRGLPKRKAALTWVPFTHARLASSSGYGAGVDSPGWYDHLFTAPDEPVARWFTKVAAVLRERDLPVSSAHVIEAVRLAEALAALRGRSLPGLAEVQEAALAVLCEGDPVPLRYVTNDLVVGERLGSVPQDTPAVPLEVDLVAQARKLRLKREPVGRRLALDLRRDTDRGRSQLLHRLAVLGIDWGTPAADDVASTGTFRETWDVRWRPELAVAVIDAARFGTTVAGAAAARLVHDAATATDLVEVTRTVEKVLLTDLPEALPDVLRTLDEKAALDVDVVHLMTALPPLVRAQRYGDVRGTDTAALRGIVEALLVRICAGLPAAVTGLGEDAAREMRTAVDGVHAALALFNEREDLARWTAALRGLVDRRDVHGLLAGRIVRLLADGGVLGHDEVARRLSAQLSIGVPPAAQAAWVEGLLSGGGLLLAHDQELVALIDEWVTGLAEEDFVVVLPLLRRTFGQYSRAEREEVARAVGALDGRQAGPADEAVDDRRAAPAVAAVAALLRGAR
ncbi:hypothetical protein SAMN05443637_10999 [Pseudonocardia thermophila]|uniref:Uncharacterized protein n=1 Tax=Pseudonocardia thermophila TaxID=1848 RepID=A0A1M6U309_PSETH|nr:DUF5682 family protein [Pseudonocardia thermophila]SHK63549.1 hypothetical protein SAMN05443637_10999 [Pseudonocardia thermophila]